MMKTRFSLVILAATALSLATSNPALAQGLYRGSSDNPNGPTVSPYLNLLNNGTNPFSTTNYQSLVKPLVDQRGAIQRQGGALQRLENSVYSGAPSGGGTGHATFFMNYSHFYPVPPR